MSFSEWSVIWRILLAALLGYIVGLEREWRSAAAGDRTFALIAIGASAVTAIGVEAFPASAEKVIAGVVTGVGFMGAGLIFRGQGGVHGLTTAAASWAVASMAILVGSGAPTAGLVVTASILFILEMDRIPGLRVLHRVAARDRPDDPPEGTDR
jgi:putative Mg2+ transporter-C (MgtC) family protein